MSTTFSIACFRSSVVETTRSVFETMLDLTPVEGGTDAGYEAALTGAVYYAGAWKGALLLECSVAQAIDWARRILGAHASADLDDDAKDALGELTNMLAGNLKAVLPGGVGLTIPSVVVGSDSSLRLCGGNLAERLLFQCATGPFRVTLIWFLEEK